VVITEKLHGTLMSVSVVPTSLANEKFYKSRVVLTSKGMGARGFILDHDDETNIYAQAAKKHGLLDSALEVLGPIAEDTGLSVFIFGEVFGRTMSGAGIQDLTYTDEQVAYRPFDVCIGNRGTQQFLNFKDFGEICDRMNLVHVPVMYMGPYSKEIVLELTDGKTVLGGRHIREGVVVKSAVESKNPDYGRKIAKSVSAAYLLRKSDNATEYA